MRTAENSIHGQSSIGPKQAANGTASAQLPSTPSTRPDQNGLAALDTFIQLQESYRVQKPDSDAAIRLKKQVITKKQSLKFSYAGPDWAVDATKQGNAVLARAQSNDDYERAADLFSEAMRLDPWWSEPILGFATAPDHVLRSVSVYTARGARR